MNERTAADLASENEQLRAAFEGMKAERDLFRNAYFKISGTDEPGFTKADFESGVPSGPWLDQFVDAIRSGHSDPGQVFPWRTSK